MKKELEMIDIENINIDDFVSEAYYREVSEGIKRGIALKRKEIKAEARHNILISTLDHVIAKGETRGINKSVLKLLQKGFTAKQVAELLNLNLSDVESLKSSHS
jgi:DNA invertase Pin-like site-specific DNA recombinase